MSFINKELKELYNSQEIKSLYELDCGYNKELNYNLYTIDKFPLTDYKIDVIEFMFDEFDDEDPRLCNFYIKLLIRDKTIDQVKIRVVKFDQYLYYTMDESGELHVKIDHVPGMVLDSYHLYIQGVDVYPDLIKSAKVKITEMLIRLNRYNEVHP